MSEQIGSEDGEAVSEEQVGVAGAGTRSHRHRWLYGLGWLRGEVVLLLGLVIEEGGVHAVVDAAALAVAVVGLGGHEEDGRPLLEDVGAADSEGGRDHCLVGRVPEVEDQAGEQVDAHRLGLDVHVQEVRDEGHRVQLPEEASAGGSGSGSHSLGRVEAVNVGLLGDEGPLLVGPVDDVLPLPAARDRDDGEAARRDSHEADDRDELYVDLGHEGGEGALEVLGQRVDVGVVAEGLRGEALGVFVGEDVVGSDVEDVGGPEVLAGIKVPNLEVGAVVAGEVLDEDDGGDAVLAADVVLDAADERRVALEEDPVEVVEHLHLGLAHRQHAHREVRGVLELDDVEVALELDVHQLVGRPELGVDGVVELDDLLVELRLGHLGGADEERDPVVAAVAVEVGGQEVVAVDEVAPALVDEDHDVDLVLGVHEARQPVVDQPHVASLEVQRRVGRAHLVEAQPGELAQRVLVRLVEGREGLEVPDLLPLLEGLAVAVEDGLVDLEQGGLLGAAVVLRLVLLLQQEGLEVDGHLHVVHPVGNADRNVQDPLLLEGSQAVPQLRHDGREAGLLLEGRQVEGLVLRGLAHHEHRLNVGVVVRLALLVLAAGVAGLVVRPLEAAGHVLEVEPVVPEAHQLPCPAGVEGPRLDDVPVGLDDRVEREADLRVLLRPGHAHLREALLLLGRGGVSSGGAVVDLDGGGDVLGGRAELDGEGVEAGESEGGVPAGGDWVEAVERVERLEDVEGDGVVAGGDVLDLDDDFGLWIGGEGPAKARGAKLTCLKMSLGLGVLASILRVDSGSTPAATEEARATRRMATCSLISYLLLLALAII